MPDYCLRPQALSGLKEIWDYASTRWSEDRAEQYLRMMDKCFVDLARNPVQGTTCEDIRKEYRKYTAGSHIVFYRIIDPGVENVRILHQRMDLSDYL